MPSERAKGGIVGPPPGTSSVGLVLIDFINPMDFDGAETMLGTAGEAAKAVRRLRTAADRLAMPTIYVNDNHGQWRSEKAELIEHCKRAGSPGAAMTRTIAPRARDYFVIKPHLSGFYATCLPILLPKLGIDRIVLCGLAADSCVLFTAADGHMRDYDLWIPADCVASETGEQHDVALDIMRKSMDAETKPTTELSLARWAKATNRKAERAAAARS